MVQEIKNLRIKIDGLSQLIKELKPLNEVKHIVEYPDKSTIAYLQYQHYDGKPLNYNSKEIEKAYDSLILAKAWLGKLAGELGESTPYANDGNRKTVEDIEPTADTDTGLNAAFIGYYHLAFIATWENKSHIEKVDFLRQEIEKIKKEILEHYSLTFSPSRVHSISNFCAYNHLTEARFYLGFELGRTRDNK